MATSDSPVPSYSFDYDPVFSIAKWTFSTPLVLGKYMIKLPDTVVGTNGLWLDGDWSNPFNTPDNPNDSTPTMPDDDPGDHFPSGEGTPGGDFRFNFGVLPGDFDRNGIVNGADDDAGTLKDGNGDGKINSADAAIVSSAITASKTLLPFTKSYGDYLDDEIVNNEDYILWRSTFASQTDLRADGNGNSIVDAADYIVWRSFSLLQSAWYIAPGTGASSIPVVDFENAPMRGQRHDQRVEFDARGLPVRCA